MVGFVSIFTFGLPIIIFCLPYALYFYILQRFLKVSKKVTINALIITILGFIIVIVGVESFYEPIEKRIYFSKETTSRLEAHSLVLFEEETGEKGKVIRVETTSKKADWNEADMTSIQQRMFGIEIVSEESNKDKTQHYIFIFDNGDWELQKGF